MRGRIIQKAPRPSRQPYFVDGVQLVNVGAELCEACGIRAGVGRSVSGLVVCAACAREYDAAAQELAREAVA